MCLDELACDRKAVLRNQQQVLTETASPDLFTTHQPISESLKLSNNQPQLNLATESDKRLSPTPSTNPSQSTTPRHACDISQSVIIENGRTLRIDYRNLHHVNVHSIDRCQSLCSHATIKCSTFAYNQRTGDCLLSSTSIDKNNRFMLVTQPNPNFDLYSFLGSNACAYSKNKEMFINNNNNAGFRRYFNNNRNINFNYTLIQ